MVRPRWLKVFRPALISSLILLFTLAGVGPSIPAERKPVLVKLETSLGEITLELDEGKAPVTVDNFLKYVKDGFYNGTIFHRVMGGFMIQGGGLDADMQEKPTQAPIKNEADNGLTNSAYTIAMARTPDPHSASSQFFINVVDNAMLNHTGKTPQGWGYAVFGKVVKGKEVVDKIKAVPTTTKGPFQNVPQEPVIILKATVVEQ